MNSIWQVFVGSLNGGKDSEVSSRRLITMIIMQVVVIISLSIIVLAFIVALRVATTSPAVIQGIDKLIELVIISYVVVLLLVGLITWQNVNDTLTLIRGGGITQNIAKAADQIQDKAQDIKDQLADAPKPKPAVA